MPNEVKDDDYTIEEMNYSSCNLKEIPDEIWLHGKALKTLIIESNSIKEIPDVSTATHDATHDTTRDATHDATHDALLFYLVKIGNSFT